MVATPVTKPPTTPHPLFDRATREALEQEALAPFAMKSARSDGRRHDEPRDTLRTCWERDRDRVVHSTAFRRLMYKTQVFVEREGDHNRTRLSHSLEVCQVARSIGGALGLNEPLCEAIGLAHDIGHPPFGHRGEWALDSLMAEHGGFRHNAQVLRVVDLLERRSPAYPGLNLTREVRESLLKHERAEDWPEEFGTRPRFPCLEGQVADLADSTAYNAHDVEDGLRAGMFTERDLEEHSALWRRVRATVEGRHPGFLGEATDASLRAKRLTTELLKVCLVDLIHASHARIHELAICAPEDARGAEHMGITHGAELAPEVAELQRFLYARFYRHPHLQELTKYADRVLSALFHELTARPDEMAPWYREWADEVGLERAVCDYLAGMTDRFAEREFERLTGRVT